MSFVTLVICHFIGIIQYLVFFFMESSAENGLQTAGIFFLIHLKVSEPLVEQILNHFGLVSTGKTVTLILWVFFGKSECGKDCHWHFPWKYFQLQANVSSSFGSPTPLGSFPPQAAANKGVHASLLWRSFHCFAALYHKYLTIFSWLMTFKQCLQMYWVESCRKWQGLLN